MIAPMGVDAGGRAGISPAAAPFDPDWSAGAWERSCLTRLVRQREGNDCGLACLAMVARLSYDAAFATFCSIGLDTKRQSKRFSSNFKDLTLAISTHGLACARRRWSSWEDFSGLGVIKVRARGGLGRDWHWVVAESHPRYGLVVRDPASPLAGLARPPEGVVHQDPYRYTPYGNWLAVMPQPSELGLR